MRTPVLSSKNAKQMLPALIAGLLASVLWIIGDILIVGFTPAPEHYPLLSETYASQVNVELATLMLSGSTSRLMWGALLAVFSIPLYLYGVFALGYVVKRKIIMAVFLPLFFGFSYAPLAHASFFYVGEIYKVLMATDVAAHAQLLAAGASFTKVLYITWIASIGFTALGWLVLAILILMGKTYFRRIMALANPIVFVFAIIGICTLLPIPAKDYLGCAAFNVAHFLFFLVLLVAALKARNPKKVRA